MSLDTAAIRARLDAATPGPLEAYNANEGTDYFPCWSVANDAFHNPPMDDGAWPAVKLIVETGAKGDAEFFAHAAQDVADLLAENERLRALVAPQPATERFLIDRNEDVWREDGGAYVDRSGRRLSRAEVVSQFGPVAFGAWRVTGVRS